MNQVAHLSRDGCRLAGRTRCLPGSHAASWQGLTAPLARAHGTAGKGSRHRWQGLTAPGVLHGAGDSTDAASGQDGLSLAVIARSDRAVGSGVTVVGKPDACALSAWFSKVSSLMICA